MGLKQKLVKWVALRWLRGKLKDEGSMLSKIKGALSGWKLLIGVGALGVVKVWDAHSNGNAGDIVGAVLNVIGWLPEEGTMDWGTFVPAATIVVGAVGKLWRVQQQARAGTSVAGLLSTEGYVRAARAAERGRLNE